MSSKDSRISRYKFVATCVSPEGKSPTDFAWDSTGRVFMIYDSQQQEVSFMEVGSEERDGKRFVTCSDQTFLDRNLSPNAN